MGYVNEKSETQARIVRYWRAVEYFSPPKVDPVDPEKGVRPVHHGRSLPWEPGVLGSPGDKKVWRHTVYAGIFNIGKVREVLELAAPAGGRIVHLLRRLRRPRPGPAPRPPVRHRP